MLRIDDDPLAIPLWINGHAYLTMTSAFLDVRNPNSGQVLRRVPMCGSNEVEKAVAAARAALLEWSVSPVTTRAGLLAGLAEVLAGYARHFSSLIAEETGWGSDAAAIEVDAAVTLLRDAAANLATNAAAGVVGIVGNPAEPLLSALRLAVPALLAGAVVVVRTSPEAPSALFALAELTGRCGFPGGVFNIVHGGEAATDGLRRYADVPPQERC